MAANLEDTINSLTIKNDKKIVLLILDGLGDLAAEEFGWKTPLEAAKTPNLDRLATYGVTGRLNPVAPGITPGSGPGHISLFGYDPLKYSIGRGVLEAVGLGMDLREGDLAARANFATMHNGLVVDRRAGRIPTEVNRRLVDKLSSTIKEIDGTEVLFQSGMQHRFAVIFRGGELGDALNDTDPHRENEPLHKCVSGDARSKRAAEIVNTFVEQALPLLEEEEHANAFMLRGFANRPNIPSMETRFKLNPACIAVYPMYKGLASLVGMDLLKTGTTVEDEFDTLAQHWSEYDFFFVHVKGTDSSGEDGDFARKVGYIEEVDRALPQLMDLKPDVLAITGDHSTPAAWKAHSWHPVPVVVHGRHCGRDQVTAFHENACNVGGLGQMETKHLMTVLLANAGKMDKYGA